MEGIPPAEEVAAATGSSFFFPPGKILLNKYRPKYPPMMAKDSCHSLGKIFLREQREKGEKTRARKIEVRALISGAFQGFPTQFGRLSKKHRPQRPGSAPSGQYHRQARCKQPVSLSTHLTWPSKPSVGMGAPPPPILRFWVRMMALIGLLAVLPNILTRPLQVYRRIWNWKKIEKWPSSYSVVLGHRRHKRCRRLQGIP